MNEEILVNKCIEGDNRAQKKLFDLFAPKLLGVCLRYMKDNDLAQDTLQDGFIKIFTKLTDYNGKGSFEGWMRRIVVNTCLDQLRKDQKLKMNTSIDDVSFLVKDNHWIEEELTAKDLLKLVESLPDGYRVVFNMFAIEGYSHKEIANELNISENTSKSQFSRAKSHLRKKLIELGIER
jgi:RNA polymerase sigma-70 factor (ECF subfamily)